MLRLYRGLDTAIARLLPVKVDFDRLGADHGLVAESCGLVLPTANCIHSRAAKQRSPRDGPHSGDSTGVVYIHNQDDFPLNVELARHCRILRWRRVNQLCRDSSLWRLRCKNGHSGRNLGNNLAQRFRFCLESRSFADL